MAAKNKDSKSIFDLYVNRYLNEETSETEKTESPFKKNEPAKPSWRTAPGVNSGGGPTQPVAQAPTANPDPGASSGIDLTTGMNQAPDSQYTGGGLSLQPQGSTDFVGNARSANETQDRASSLGLQNYNQGGGFEPQQVDIGTGTVGQGQMPPPSPSTSTSGTTTPAAPQPPSKEDIQRYGRTGAELRQSSGNQFMTRSDRMDQAKVDQILGAGKYKAGTAEANLALANYFKQNPTTVAAGRPGAPTGSPAATTAAPTSTATAPNTPASTGAAPTINTPKPGQVASQQEVLGRIKQALGTQGYDVSDSNKLMGIAKGMGLL